MRKLATCLAALAFVGAAVYGPNQANARPDYQKAFLAKYTTLSEEDKEKKCAMCHGAESKKERNDYSIALEKALGAKNVKDAEKIEAALVEVEGKEYEDGKTYGALLKSGKLPAPFKK